MTLYFILFQLSLVKYYAKPLSTFHQINCYEENGFLVMDMCCSDDGQAINNYMIQNLKKSGNALDEVNFTSTRKYTIFMCKCALVLQHNYFLFVFLLGIQHNVQSVPLPLCPATERGQRHTLWAKSQHALK